MEKYGFVYLWYDRKHKRFYIGSHWGTEDDGYICSSSWMKQAYRIRSHNFKRRIISRIYSNRKDLLSEEYLWLSKIRDDELGKRYYNLTNHKNGHWSSNESVRQEVSNKLKGQKRSSEFREATSKKTKGRFWITDGVNCKTLAADSSIPDGWKKGRINPKLLGKKRPKDVVVKYVESRKQGAGWAHTDETKAKIAASHTGLPQSDSHKMAISLALKGKPSNNPSGRTAK